MTQRINRVSESARDWVVARDYSFADKLLGGGSVEPRSRSHTSW